MSDHRQPIPRSVLFSRTVVGIVLATFFSDVGHEMATAVLPVYLLHIGLGPAALGAMEGVADLLFSMSKLAGGIVGHRLHRKKAVGAFAYAVTAAGVAMMGLARSASSLVALRGVAWLGRGFRSPLRDYLLSDAVPATHFGRVYGIERSADMLGAVGGPVIAAILVALSVDLHTVILVSVVPSALAAASFYFLTKKDAAPHEAHAESPAHRGVMAGLRAIPRGFYVLLGGVFVFGLGDFSRTFLIVLAARDGAIAPIGFGGVLGFSVGLYAVHNLVSAIVAVPTGALGDRHGKLRVLTVGYAIGIATNATLAFAAPGTASLLVAIFLSATTLAVEETLEKAATAELLPRDLRSLGLGILAAANALGDMLSSIFVGYELEHGSRTVAFGVPAALSMIGTAWIAVVARRQGYARPA